MNPNSVRRGRRLNWLLCFLACALLQGTRCYAAPVNQLDQLKQPSSSESKLLGRWMTRLQYTDPKLPSYGGLKIHHDSAAPGDDGTRYYRVSPYNANLGVLGLLSGNAPESASESRQTAVLWMEWYFAHLNAQSAPDGVPYEHFYRADGDGETTCLNPGDRALCHYNDATDSAAATFFSVLWAAYKAGVHGEFFNTLERKQQIEKLAAVLLNLQQDDGLCWAKLDYRVKYLEDNCEVYAGLRDLAALEKTLFQDAERAQYYEQAARRVREGILRELYDARSGLYHIAKFETGKLHKANLDVWYADTQAQMWPHLWGVVAPDDAKTQAVVKALNSRWNGDIRPHWAVTPGGASNGWIESGVAYALLLSGDKVQTRTYLQAVKRLKLSDLPEQKRFAWPFSIADAGWLLQMQAENH